MEQSSKCQISFQCGLRCVAGMEAMRAFFRKKEDGESISHMERGLRRIKIKNLKIPSAGMSATFPMSVKPLSIAVARNNSNMHPLIDHIVHRIIRIKINSETNHSTSPPSTHFIKSPSTFRRPTSALIVPSSRSFSISSSSGSTNLGFGSLSKAVTMS